MINVVLCGGNGTRLWPLSRSLFPKQFNKMIQNRSLFQLTVERNQSFCDKTIVVSNEEHYFLALDHLDEINGHAEKFVLEPIGRNTAPAIALACLSLDEQELVLVTPSDHIVRNEEEYARCIEEAEKIARTDHLVTFGIHPTYAETGYGYIEAEGGYVKSFKEKPDEDTAKQYILKGNYYWNSGMFMFKSGVFLSELKRHSPEIYEASVAAFQGAQNHYDTIRICKEDMDSIPSDSIDYAVMERSELVRMVSANIGWSDMGSFESFYDELPKDDQGNTVSDNYMGLNSSNNLILSEDRLIAAIDVNDLIIVDTADALLVSRKGSSHKVKEIVQDLRKRNSDLCDSHVTAYRPWGHHTILDAEPSYKIKKVVVKPGHKTKLQKHYHRNEHWIVVSGTALITVNGEQRLLRTNESTFIRMGDEHRLENPGKINLHLIEVQVGEYVGEDDVVRN
ncbi:mannose-1-phosphate guanylyltransferase/mannose-6-phosphate isomerase [Paenibacillus sp. JSM ZJ436]|uniref:mannose-1-phosphate guanylyltransferase/mannose-6-phosphate isomerase n=1 Tax=Paenibacillus sp. JSM ZJ436 TaxID=3376190 RepID=UPI00379A420A